MNVDLTQNAIDMLEKLVVNKETEPLRLFVAGYGWGGPTFGLTQDELKEGDLEIEEEGFRFVFEDTLADVYSGFKVDYMDGLFRKGFIVSPLR